VSRLENPTNGLVKDVLSDVLTRFGIVTLFADIMYMN